MPLDTGTAGAGDAPAPESAKLSFMTWICPKFSVEELVTCANKVGYDAVELRTDKGHGHGVELGTADEALAEVRDIFAESGVAVSALATGLSFADPDPGVRAGRVAELKRYVDLAEAVGAPVVRVFAGDLPRGIEVAGVVDYVADALGEAAESAEGRDVVIGVETHGDFSVSRYAAEVVKQVYSDRLRIVWDVAHPVRYLEGVDDTYDVLCGYVAHVHVHDYVYDDGRRKIVAAPFGEGFVPNAQALRLLARDGYAGYLSVEYEDANVDVEEVLAQYAQGMRACLEPAEASVEAPEA